MTEMSPEEFRARVTWLSTDSIEIGYVVQALLSVSTQVYVNQLPSPVWAELAVDPDPQHLSGRAREALSEFLTERAKVTESDLRTQAIERLGTRGSFGTEVDVLSADVFVQVFGTALPPNEELDLQTNPVPLGNDTNKESE